jgi:hypothetical protein
MINSEPKELGLPDSTDEAVDGILRSGMPGAVVLAGLATAVVVGRWLAFYFLVFLARSAGP